MWPRGAGRSRSMQVGGGGVWGDARVRDSLECGMRVCGILRPTPGARALELT